MRFAVRILCVLSICLIAIGWYRWSSVKQEDASAAFQMPRIRSEDADWPGMLDTLRVLRRTIVSRDLFRSTGTTETSAFGAAAASPLPRNTWAGVRPTLTLKATAGPPWQAIIDGLPGQTSAAVVRAGSVFDRLTIKSVSRDTVFVQSPDGTWVLSLSKTP
jgi:hypothetical protein